LRLLVKIKFSHISHPFYLLFLYDMSISYIFLSSLA
jgi:hypothetical protein